jgi:hypothetical protein
VLELEPPPPPPQALKVATNKRIPNDDATLLDDPCFICILGDLTPSTRLLINTIYPFIFATTSH